MQKNKLMGLLREIRTIAAEATMTGMLKGAKGMLINQYNVCLKIALEANSIDTPELFPTLPEDTSMDDVGAAASLLARYLRDEEEEQRW